MSLNVLIRTQRNAILTLDDACYTQANYSAAHTNNTLSVNTPRGVLGGSIAAIGTDDYTAIACTRTARPLGLFLNDAAGAAFDNQGAVAAGKVSVIKGMASVEVDVYETHNAGNVIITYALGDKLYSSAGGLLTNVAANDATDVIGILTKVPTVDSPVLGLDMRI